MKKIKLLFLLPLLLLTGCTDSPRDNDGNVMSPSLAPNFSIVCSHEYIEFVRDVDTDIMYMYFVANKRAALSTYYNSKGEPMTYTEFKTVHTEKYHG